MDSSIGARLHHLDRALPERRVLKLERARGARVVCASGEVWITEDGRHDDVVLAAGESAVLEHPGLAMVTPFGSADVEVVLPAAARSQIDPALIERHMQAARHLRAQTIAAMFADALRWLRTRASPAPQRECCA